MSEGIEERLRHEASEDNGIISRVYAGDVIEVIDALRSQLAASEKELRKWQEPFDQVRFDAMKEQAGKDYQNGLAAQYGYIIALEHALKHSKKELAVAKGLLKELEFSDISDWGCFCPICGKEKHTNNCRLAAMIAGSE